MKKVELLKDIFIEHHNCLGMDLEEAEDLFNESDLLQVEKWLLKKGYELDEKII